MPSQDDCFLTLPRSIPALLFCGLADINACSFASPSHHIGRRGRAVFLASNYGKGRHIEHGRRPEDLDLVEDLVVISLRTNGT